MKLGKILMGITLILAGALLLMINMGIIADIKLYQQWPLILIFIGLSLQFEVIDSRNSWGALIPGGILFTYGILLYVCANVSWSIMGDWWPVFILGPAFGLLEAYFFGERSTGLLIAGGIVGLIGLVFLAQNLFGLYNLILPLSLIIVGLIILVIGFRKSRVKQ